MIPSATESTTARATAACAGPNICTACAAPLIVTLLNMIVSGFAGRLGVTTASSVVKPSLLFVRAFTNAEPAGPCLEPMIRSMCATSLPSPTSDSPMKKSAAMGLFLRTAQGSYDLRERGYCWRRARTGRARLDRLTDRVTEGHARELLRSALGAAVW